MASTYSGKSEDYFDGANPFIVHSIPRSFLRCLDIGCASGLLGRALKQINPARKVYGIEFVENVAREAEKNLDRVACADIESDPFPFPDERFDVISFGDVLEHLREPWDVLAKFMPYLEDSGILVCNVPNVGHWSVILELLQGKFEYQDSGLLDRTHLRFFTLMSFREMLGRVGFNSIFSLPNPAPNERVSHALAEAMAKLMLPFESVMRTTSAFQFLVVSKKADDVLITPWPRRPKIAFIVDKDNARLAEMCQAELRDGDAIVSKASEIANQEVAIQIDTPFQAIPGWSYDLTTGFAMDDVEVSMPIEVSAGGLLGMREHLPPWTDQFQSDEERMQFARAYGHRRIIRSALLPQGLIAMRAVKAKHIAHSDFANAAATMNKAIAPGCLVALEK